MKRFVKGLLLAVGVLVSSSSWAQVYCPDGGIPNPTGQFAGLCSDGSVPQAGGGGGSGGNGGYVPPTVIHIPTSYGAVAWDGKTGTYGYSSRQVSERASKQAALADCGLKACKVLYAVSNACISAAHGAVNGNGYFATAGDVNQRVAEQKAIAACEEKTDNCQIVMSECSLAGQIDGR